MAARAARPPACLAAGAPAVGCSPANGSSSQRLIRSSLLVSGPPRFMRLDAAAQRALHVFPARGDANVSFSLYGLMCRARTAMGKRRLKVRAPGPRPGVACWSGRSCALAACL